MIQNSQNNLVHLFQETLPFPVLTTTGGIFGGYYRSPAGGNKAGYLNE